MINIGLCETVDDELKNIFSSEDILKFAQEGSIYTGVQKEALTGKEISDHRFLHKITYYMKDGDKMENLQNVITHLDPFKIANAGIFTSDDMIEIIISLVPLVDFEEPGDLKDDYNPVIKFPEGNFLLNDMVKIFYDSSVDFRRSALKSLMDGELSIAHIKQRVLIEIYLKFLLFNSVSSPDLMTSDPSDLKIPKSRVPVYIENNHDYFNKDSFIKDLKKINLYSGLNEIDKQHRKFNEFVHQRIYTTNQELDQSKITSVFLKDFAKLNDFIFANLIAFAGFLILGFFQLTKDEEHDQELMDLWEEIKGKTLILNTWDPRYLFLQHIGMTNSITELNKLIKKINSILEL